MVIPIYQVDAFTSRRFGGNPAAVCPLQAWLPDATMQSIAAENNLAETAFFTRENGRLRLRWFTPAVEVDLCGHATLATAWVLFHELGEAGDRVVFDSRSGELAVTRDGDRLCLDFPSLTLDRVAPHERLIDGLGAQPLEVFAGMDWMAVYASEADVRALQPDFRALALAGCRGVIATASGNDCDFVSRFFAPASGIDEDPVTGSAHCALSPYWSRRLGKTSMHVRQLSQRGGELWVEARGERTLIAGHCVPYLKGEIRIE